MPMTEGTVHITNIRDLHIHSGIHNGPPDFDGDIVAYFLQWVKFFLRNVGLFATMVGNKECTDTIVVNVVDIQESHKEIVVEPNFTRLSLFRSATFSAFVFDNDTQLSDVVTCVCSGADPTCYTFIDNGNNNWTLKNNKQSQIPLILTFTSGDLITELEVTLGAMY
jgi:hypothetical protein